MQRRDLLKLAMLGACGPTLGLTAEAALANSLQGRRLVLVQLDGANDGLNTLVPARNDHYHRLRPSLSLSNNDLVELHDDFYVHQRLTPLMDAWQQGELAWVHGLGYPAPNRSHFKSIALWESGGDGQKEGRRGWVTHDIQHSLGRKVSDAHGISFANDMNLFNSDTGRWLSFTSPEQIKNYQSRGTASSSSDNLAINLVAQRMQELNSTLSSLEQRLSITPKAPRVGRGELGAQLQQVLHLIRAGLDTPIYRVKLSGFDTHQDQLGRHSNLLSQLANSLAQFRTRMIQDGEWGNTLVMTYSEFGRRASENQSGGTDHGTAAPHLLMGGGLSGGLFGEPTDLSQLVDGDPAHTMDYRSLYQLVLSNWFGVQTNQFSDFYDERLNSLVRA